MTEDTQANNGQLTVSGQLSIQDPDRDQTHFSAGSLQGQYGYLTIDVNGHWIYSADNSLATVQSLKSGEHLTDTFTIHSADGTAQNITVTINGTDDKAEISGTTSASLTEDDNIHQGMLRANGNLAITDNDHEPHLFTATEQYGQFGTLIIDELGHWTYTADNSQTAIQALKTGESITDTLVVQTQDGTQQTISISIHGTDDHSVIMGTSVMRVFEDKRLSQGQLHTDGQLWVSNPDTGRAGFAAEQLQGQFGILSINTHGHWTYTADNNNPSIQALKHGESLTETLFVQALDGTTQKIAILIKGADDKAIIGGTDTATLVEDQSPQHGQLQAHGTLTITDPDAGQAQFTALTDVAGSNGYGHFSLDSSGVWTYNADNTQTAVQQLKTGESLTDTLTVTSADRTSHTVTVTIQGCNDAPVLVGQTQSVTEDGTQLSGKMIATDVDAGDTQTFSLVNAIDGFTLNADGSYNFDPSHASYQHLTAGQTQDVVIAITVTDSTGATSYQNLTISVTGANDGAVIGGVNIGAVSEDNTLTASGKLTISDVDSTQAGFIAQNNLAATHGCFTLSASGDWTYALDNSNAAVQALKTGESLTDTVTINSIDGTQHTIAVTINGSNDGAIIAGVDTATATEDANVIAGNIEACGQLTISDPDAGQSHFTAQTDVAGSSGYGQFSLNSTGAWTYSADNTQAAIQQLKAGDSLTDTLTITSADGTIHTLTVTIQGTNDAPVLAAQSQAVTEDGTQLSGHMVATDADAGDNLSFSIAQPVDGFTLNADGSYSFDPSHASYQHLAAGQTQTITIPVTVTDVAGATSTRDLVIKLNGSNDGAVITGTDVAAVTEDQTAGSGHFLQVTGTLTVADVDAGEAVFQATSTKSQLGDFILHSDGSWMYQADNTNTAVQALKAGQQTTDSFTVLSTDGTAHTITITITGSNDAPTVAHALTTTTATEDSAFSFSIPTGTFADIDAGDTLTLSAGSLPAWLHFDAATGTFSGTPTNGDVGTMQVTITATDANGAQVSTTFALTVANTNDAPTLNPIATVHATEDGAQVTGQFTATDPDSGDTLIYSIAQPVNGFTLNADGSYSFDPSHTSYQQLAAGQTQDVLIPITVTDSAGATSTQNLTITVTGSNDGAVISGTDSGSVIEDQQVSATHILSCGGKLAVTDVDTGEATFAVQHGTGANGYGSFVLGPSGTWTYSADNTQAAIQQLKAGETLTDTFTVSSTDGTTHTVTVTIQGSNDAPVLAAQTKAVTEDGALLTGKMVATDADAGDTQVFSTAQTVDGFTLNADGSYKFDPSHASYQHLAAGQTQDMVIPVTVTDNAGATSTQNLTITVTGTNDAAVVSGRVANAVNEDGVVSTGGLLRASGLLTVVDPDAGEAVFVAQTGVAGAGHYGSFSIDASGHYSYTADNSQTAIQQLKAGETLADRFTVTTADGTQQVVTITIKGAEDRPVLQAQTHAVTEDGARLTGQMLATDVDAGDTQRFSVAHPVAGFVLNPDGSFSFNPAHASYQHLAAGQTQDIVIPVTVIDSAGGVSTQNLTITVTGVNDRAVISGVSNGRITEDQGVSATHTLSCGGKLDVTDVDTGEAAFAVQHGAGANGYGNFVLDPSGNWTYSADNTQSAIQQLKAGETLTGTFTVSSTDGTTHTVTVTIQGTNDAPVLAAQTQAVTEDGTLLQGRMVATDVDANDTKTFSSAQSVDGFTLNADGSYSFDPSHASYQHLAAGQTQTLTIPVTVTDSEGATSTQNLTIRLTGTNDAPHISGADVGRVVEDQTLSVSGKLAISDADDGQAHFIAQTATTGSYGSLTIGEDGQWQYQLDNTKPEVQALKSTETATDTFTVHSADGSSHNITITIQGQRDNVVIGGVDVGVVKEDVSAVTGGHLVATGESAEFVPLQQHTTLGNFAMDASGAWTYTLDNSHASTQALKAGETATDTVSITHTDGTTHTVTITVMGTNDAPVLTAQSQAVTEDSTLLTGQITASDVDRGDTQIFSLAHAVDGFTLNTDGRYSFDPAHGSYQHLATGQTQTLTIPIIVTDSVGASSTANLTITLTGTNDGATIGGVSTGTASEDSTLLTTGQLTIADADDGEAHFVAQPHIQGLHGSFSLSEDGQWRYSADSSQAAVQQLKAGDSLSEHFTVHSADGTAHTVTVTLQGTNDAPVLQAQHQSVSEDASLLQGQMVASDVDHGDTQTFSIAQAVDGFTLNADGSYSFDPSNAAYQHLTAGQTEDLVIPVTVTDSAGASHTQNLTITITGTNDGAVIGGAFTGAVTEDQSVQSGQLQASGQLTITDADSGESHFIPQTDVLGSDGLGRFSLDAQGQWSYSADNSQKAIQQLAAGATLNDSFTVQGADGAQHTVTVTLTGTNDAPQFHLQVAPDYHPEVESSDVLPLVINNIGSSRIAQYLDIQQILQGQAPIGAYANTCVTVSLGGLALIGPDGQAAQVFAAGQEFKLQTLVDWQQQGPGHEFRVFGPKGTTELDLSLHDAGDPNHITGPHGQASLYVNQVMIWPPFHAWQASAGSGTGTATDSGLLTATEGGPALSGQFHASDIDVGDTLAFSLGHPVDGFTLNADDSYSFDPAHPSYQHLAAGQRETLSIPITVTDSAGASTTQTLSILLRGANDAATFGGVETGATQEDRSDALSGQLTVADADDGEAHFIAQSGTAGSYGQFSLDENGQWHYQIDNSKPEVQALRDGQNVTDSFTVRSADGTAHTVNISIAGKNDSAVITGEDHQTLTEDQNVSGGQLIAHGQLHASTPDAGGDQFTPLSDLAGKFGHLSLGADGSWVYKADNNSPAVQALHAGQSATESFTVHSVDGTAHTLSLSIQGADEPRHDIWSSIVSTIKSNWAPYNLIGHAIDAGDVGALGSMRLAFTSGNPSVVDANGHVLASGSSLGAFGHDISMGQVVDLLKSHPGARLVLDGNVGGSSGFYLHDSGDVMELHFRGLSHYNQANSPMGQLPIDGLPTPLSAAGTVPDVSDLTISVTDISVDHASQLQTSGQLNISDADAGENHFNAQKDVAGTYGSFSIDASGHWVYSVDNGQAAVQNLQAGAQLTDSFMVTSADGSSHVISVAVYGKNDAPVLFAQSQSVSEDGALLSGQMHASDVDAGDTLSFRIDQAVAGFTLNADGSYSFDPSNAAYQHLAAGQTQTLVIPVFVTDHMGASSVQDLTITLTGANDGPQVLHATAATAGDLGAVNEDTPRVFTEAELLQAVGATDPDDGGSLHIVAGSLTSSHGTFTGDAAHGFTFTPTANFSGQDIDLQFSVTDGSATREAHVQLDITPVADAPLRVTAPTITTDFDSISLPGVGWTQTDPSPTGWHTDESSGVEIGQERLYGGSGNNQILSLTASWGSNIYRELPTQAGEAVHLGFDLSARPGFAVTPLEVLWEGKVIDTITPVAGSYSMLHHDYDLLANGSNSRLELRASGQGEARVLIDNIQIGPPEHVLLGDHDTLLKPYLGFQLADTDGSETLSYGIHGLPVGFTLTDGTHSAIVSSAGQVIETAGWNQDTLAVRAPQGFQGTVSIQVTAHAEEGSNHQTANAADLTLELRLVPVSHAAVISGENAITLTEDQQVDALGFLEHFGQLNVSDPDAGEAKFVAQNAVNTQYGRYTIGGDGYWLYEADNKLPAIQQLKTGESLTDSFTVHSIDGTPQTITVTIQGQDDVAAFVPQAQAAQVDSADVYTQISVQLLDSQHREFEFMGEVLLANTDPRNYIDAEMSFTNTGVALRAPDGSLSKVYHAEGGMTTVPVMDLRAWHNKGQGYEVVLVDATGMPVNVFPHDAGDPDKLSGFNQYVTGFSGPFNAAVVLYPDMQAASSGGAVQGGAFVPAIAPLLYDAAHVLEDNGQQISGFIEVQDADKGQSSMQAMTDHHAAHGTFSIDVNGDWVYQLDSRRPDVQALKAGETLLETITVHSADGTPHEVNITIHGQNDGAVISGADTGQLVEDQNVSAASTLEAHGQLTVTDADAGEAAFVAQNAVATQFGHISIDASGAWRYEVDNNKADVQALKAGESLTEHLTVSSVDGTTHVLTVTVQGSNDAPVLQAQSQSVTEDGSLLRGQMVAQDADHGDVLRFTTHAAVGGFALNADGSYSFDPSHHDYQGLTAGQVRDIDIPIVVTDSAGASSIQMLSIHITGRNDSTFIYGVDSGNVQAGVHPQTSGDLHASDDDAGQSGFQAGTVKGSFGSLSIDAQGHWTYQVDGHDSFVQHLLPNSYITEQLTVHSVDGTAHDIEIEVSGAPAGSQLSAPADSANVQHVALPQVWGAVQGQPVAGHDVFAGILAAVRAGGYQYQGLADELDKGSLAAVGNMDLSITGVHAQVVDKFGQVVQSISPTAENAATLHMSDVLLWHAQGHSIIATSDSGFDSTRMWLHNTGDMHNIQVILPNGTGFNGWVGEYSLGELSLSPAIAYPAPPASDEQDDEPIQILNFNEVIRNEDSMQSMTAAGVKAGDEAVIGNNDYPLPLNAATEYKGNLNELSLSSSHGTSGTTPLTTTDAHFAAQASPVDHYLQMLGLSPTAVNLSPSVPVELLPSLSSSDHFNDIDAPMYAIPEVNHFENPLLDNDKEQHKDRHFDLFDVTELHTNPNDDDLLHSALNDMHNQM